MSDLATLEQKILSEIAGAGDEAALEAVRVAALGKKGSISALLATLGKMSPDERKTQGAAINLAKDKVTQALTERRDVLKSAALDARLAKETIDVTLPLREATGRDRPHPSAEPGLGRATAIFADMGFSIAEGPDIETDDYNFTKLNFPIGHPAREMHDTFFFQPKEDGSRMLLRTHTSPVQVRTMLTPEAADPRDLPGPHLSHRFGRDAHAAIPPGRGPRHRQGLASRPPQMDPARVLQGVLRGRPHQHAVPAVVLPVHRAVARGRHPVPPRQGRNPLRRRRGLAGDSRLRHGASERAARSAASIPTSTRALPGAWASTASPC